MKVASYFENEKGNGNHMLVIQDVYTQWLQAYPVPKKDTESVLDRIPTYFGSEYHPTTTVRGERRFPLRSTQIMPMSSVLPSKACIGLLIPVPLTEKRPTALLRGLSVESGKAQPQP